MSSLKEKRYIASTTGGRNSGTPQDYETAIDWARSAILKENTLKVYIAEVFEVVEKAIPPTIVRNFEPEHTPSVKTAPEAPAFRASA